MHRHAVSALTRLDKALEFTGEPYSSFARKVSLGLMPRPVKIGSRAVAVPQLELEAVNAARIGGQSDDQIRALVARLHAGRSFSQAEREETRF